VAFFQTASAASNEDWALVTLKVEVATFCLASLTTFFLVSTISSALKSSLSAATCSASILSKLAKDVEAIEVLET
jgi:hypothetical protein